MRRYTFSGDYNLRWLQVILFGMQCTWLSAQVPNINRIEYYVNSDPGYGNATNLGFVGTTNATATVNLDITPLNAGVHVVGIRSRDSKGAWSIDNKWIFLKPYPNSGAVQQPNITRVEWYLDTDPGFGIATPISISQGQNLSNLAINVSLPPLTQGTHIVGVRSRDDKGAWSIDNKWIFIKPYDNSGAVIQPNINRVEWYLDDDPGYGNATSIPLTPGQNPPGLAINIDVASLSQGAHIAGVRSRDANGAWSIDNKWVFIKPYPNTGAATQPNINRVEWFLDTDPGYGNATPISINAGQNLPNLGIALDLVPLSQGVHIVGVRSRDANGAWSLDNKWIFIKPYTGASAAVQPKIVKVEYYIDSDPGHGNATPVTITAATNISNLIFDADIAVVPNGTHKLGIRSLDENGAWSLDNKVDFTGGTLVSNTFTWTGNANTSWTNPANWSSAVVPGISNNVVIPANRPFSPIIANSVIANCKSIKLNPGASITVATGGKLNVH